MAFWRQCVRFEVVASKQSPCKKVMKEGVFKKKAFW